MAQQIKESVTKRLYSLRDAAEYLGRSKWGMRELIWSQVIPTVQIKGGRKIYIDIEDLDTFIEKNKTYYH